MCFPFSLHVLSSLVSWWTHSSSPLFLRVKDKKKQAAVKAFSWQKAQFPAQLIQSSDEEHRLEHFSITSIYKKSISFSICAD